MGECWSPSAVTWRSTAAVAVSYWTNSVQMPLPRVPVKRQQQHRIPRKFCKLSLLFDSKYTASQKKTRHSTHVDYFVKN